MFGTSIHWTTFFYLLLDSIIVLFTLYQTIRLKCASLRRYFYLGLLYVAYNFTGGFLPMKSFPGPMILQYIITYGTAISLCIYIVYYLYKEYDIEVLKYKYSIRNLTLLTTLCFATLYLTTYYLTDSLLYSRLLFNITISIAAIIFIIIFQRRIIALDIPNPFIARRNKLSIVSLFTIVLLPICTAIGDYQWLTFTVMNIGFYAITWIEFDRYLFLLENQARLYNSFVLGGKNITAQPKTPFIYNNLTRRETEIAFYILDQIPYKSIAKELFISERTVTKHASNIFKKAEVRNRKAFLQKFKDNQKSK